MRDIQLLFDDYASYHRTAGNKWFHRIGIPMIMLTLLGLLARVHLVKTATVEIDFAMILIVLAGIYYLVLDWRLGVAMVVISVAFYLAGAALPFVVNALFFVLGWIFQFIGHAVYEKRQPAFFRNFVHLLVGPLWILNDLMPVVRKGEAQ
ncbi:MAG TPA: Mpo1-like protein [Thermoanaerobaculia bacterium]|nr:Mpo1-like protein [Thermoanaerobaculia bacterium]